MSWAPLGQLALEQQGWSWSLPRRNWSCLKILYVESTWASPCTLHLHFLGCSVSICYIYIYIYIYISIYLFIYLHISRSHIQSHNYHILLLYIFWLIGWFANSCQNRLRGCSIRTLAIRILPGTQGAESSWCLPQGCLHMTNIEQYGENMWKQWK